MTTGHKHHTVAVKEKSLTLKLLRIPLRHRTNPMDVDESRYPYGPCKTHADCWTLSALGILHRWTGLTFIFR